MPLKKTDFAEYREAFLRDEKGEFERVVELAGRLQADLENDLNSELFRLVHTIKGNAYALGYDAISSIAHGLEEHLRAPRSSAWLDRLNKACAELFSAIADAREKQNLESPSRCFYFKTLISGRPAVFQSESVLGVVRNPEVLMLPERNLNFILAFGMIMPLYRLESDAHSTHQSEYVVILKMINPKTNKQSCFAVWTESHGEVVELVTSAFSPSEVLSPSELVEKFRKAA